MKKDTELLAESADTTAATLEQTARSIKGVAVNAEDLAAAIQAAGSEGGFGMGGIMGVGTKLMAAGLGMDQMQGVTREIITLAREKMGEDTVGEIVGSIPGLGQFV